MPNWCMNTMTVRGPSKQVHDLFDRIGKADEDAFFNIIKPRPADQEENWYGWNIENWGTKWDADPGEFTIDDGDPEEGMSTVHQNFDTAWGPPDAIAEELTEQGFDVDLMYYEPGVGFAGVYTSWAGTDHYDFDGRSADELDDILPEELNDCFGITEDIRNSEELEDEDEFVEWYEDGVEERNLKPHDPKSIWKDED